MNPTMSDSAAPSHFDKPAINLKEKDICRCQNKHMHTYVLLSLQLDLTDRTGLSIGIHR